MNHFKFQWLLIIILIPEVFVFHSCVSQRDLEYLNDRNKTTEFIEPDFQEYKLKPNDALFIQINSIGDPSSNVFAGNVTERTLEPYSAYMSSYTVDKDGYVLLPVIGKINVAGKTVMSVSDIIKDSVTHILSIPTVTVKLVNRYVSVLGEVRNPGHFVYSQDKLNIFNAISLAGDITEFGNRKEVIILRNENGKNIRTAVNLTRSDMLHSPYYFIQPSDIIYVSPLRKRYWGLQKFPFELVFSTITAGLLIYTVVK